MDFSEFWLIFTYLCLRVIQVSLMSHFINSTHCSYEPYPLLILCLNLDIGSCLWFFSIFNSSHKISTIIGNHTSKIHLLDLHHCLHLVFSNVFLSFHSLNFSCTGSFINSALWLLPISLFIHNAVISETLAFEFLGMTSFFSLSSQLDFASLTSTTDCPIDIGISPHPAALLQSTVCLLISTYNLIILYSFMALLLNIYSPI